MKAQRETIVAALDALDADIAEKETHLRRVFNKQAYSPHARRREDIQHLLDADKLRRRQLLELLSEEEI